MELFWFLQTSIGLNQENTHAKQPIHAVMRHSL